MAANAQKHYYSIVLSLLCLWLYPAPTNSLINGTSPILKLGMLHITYDGSFVTSLNFSHIIQMALEHVQENNLLTGGYEITLKLYGEECGVEVLVENMIEQGRKDGLQAVFGPTTTISGTSITELATEAGLVLINSFKYAVAAQEEHHDEEGEEEEPLIVSVISNYRHIVNGLKAVIERYKWTRVAIGQSSIHEHGKHDMLSVADDLEILLAGINVTSVLRESLSSAGGQEGLKRGLRRFMEKARVVVLLVYPEEIPYVMLAAYDLGLFNNNDYVFLSLDTRSDENSVTFGWRWTGDPAIDKKLEVAYKSLIHTTKVPYFLGEEYNKFLQEVRVRLLEPPFDSNLTSISEVSNSAGYVYDAVMLYALTADSMIKEGLDPHDGRNFTKFAKTINFLGKTGAVSVNEVGDRNDDYAIFDLRNGTFQKVAIYDGFARKYVTLDKILWGPDEVDTVPADTPLCGFDGELCIVEEPDNLVVMVTGTSLGVLLILCAGVGVFFYRKNQFEAELSSANWKIEWKDISFSTDNRLKRSTVSIGSRNSHRSQPIASPNVGSFKNETVYVKQIAKASVDWKKRSILLELKMMRDVRHENLNVFVGACVEAGKVAVLTRYCAKGSLDDVLENADIQLDLLFRVSMAMDIVNGLKHLQKSEMRWHGNLKSSNCLVDNRWTIKLSDFGLSEFSKPDQNRDMDEYPKYRALLWTAPEYLRAELSPSHKGDIYSLGIVLQEIALRLGPYSENGDLAPKEIIERVKKGNSEPYRPVIPKDSCAEVMQKLMMRCWAETPSHRPDYSEISRELRILNGGKSINIMDNMVSMLEKYASNLEDIVADRTEQLVEEKKKTDLLLHQMLPKTVAEALKIGETIDPETFENVTIFFSDIVGFTSLSAESTPIEVVNLLNDLYTLFDSILEEYDVYKVETIGDAYMVVSGLPIRNGDQHAGEIAMVSLHLLSSVLSFKIRHRADRKLKLRIGIHTGPCVAGVVGLKMPRYCLFGDTVNTASRMESNGLALYIHVSGVTQHLLDKLGGFKVVERGQIEMKGKGLQTTYWLQGKDGFRMPLPDWT